MAEEELRRRAERFGQRHPNSPLQGRFKLFGANNLEDEAITVARQIQAWLSEGKRNIAVLAIDRLAARRAGHWNGKHSAR
jgi:inactivated superfamily I helicase